jgi:hypothetical protein
MSNEMTNPCTHGEMTPRDLAKIYLPRASRIARIIMLTMILASACGIGLSLRAFHKDPGLGGVIPTGILPLNTK